MTATATVTTGPFAGLAEYKFPEGEAIAGAAEAGTLTFTNAEPKRKMNHLTTSLSVFDELARATGESDEAISVRLGYSRAAISHWRRKNKMPIVASLACQYLLDCYKASAHVETIVVARIPANKKDVILPLLDSMEIPYSQV